MDVLCNLTSKYDVSIKQILCGQYGDDQKNYNGSEYLSASCSVTLIEDADVKVLVDCGSIYEKDSFCMVNHLFSVTPLQIKISFSLSKASVSPSEITHLVITHWHSDHCGNIALFPDSILITPQTMKLSSPSHLHQSLFRTFSSRSCCKSGAALLNRQSKTRGHNCR
uniref:Metallo-beta-lactamase domain-containing protein 1 n=1 Tax=Ditylenchus dipsaci TaxID=166011 RepID=A0A915CS67_9BILA